PKPAPAPSPLPPALPPLPPAPPSPPPAAPVNALDVLEVALRVLPPNLAQRRGWAEDLATSFAALSIPAQPHKVCALAAVIEQESTWQADPPVAGLAKIAKAELDKKRERYGIPKPVFDLAMAKKSPTGRSYQQRLDALRTERELSDLFEDMIREIPFGTKLFEGQNPVRTGGATQVSVAFAAQQMRERPYPWRPAGSPREEVFKRRGGLYFGAAMLLDYPVSYNRMLYRFADYNGGRYSSRNAAVQALLAQLTGQALAPDGDLLRYQAGEPLSPRTAPSQAWRALLTIQGALGVTPAQIEQDLKLEKRFEFEQSVTYRRLYQLAERRGLKPAREQLPDIELHSPKISRTLTTAWFADRCEARYRACLARDPYAAAGSVQPASTPAAPPPASSDPRP
ncbi:MAG TPA: DUF1615 domain-containing protein, partial [Burkholderiaceae bacterium]|nr:DUF1615 domain-containing protein [Burkholderiaceae bacterium]